MSSENMLSIKLRSGEISEFIIRDPEEAIAHGLDDVFYQLYNKHHLSDLQNHNSKLAIRNFFKDTKTNISTTINLITYRTHANSSLTPMAYFVMNHKKQYNNLHCQFVKKEACQNTCMSNNKMDLFGWSRLVNKLDKELHTPEETIFNYTFTECDENSESFMMSRMKKYLEKNGQVYLRTIVGMTPTYNKPSSIVRYQLSGAGIDTPWGVTTLGMLNSLHKYCDSLNYYTSIPTSNTVLTESRAVTNKTNYFDTLYHIQQR